MSVTRSVFLRTGQQLVELLSSPVVSDRWDSPSMLPEMTVGALAGHVGRAASWAIEEYLANEPPALGAQLASAAEYYAVVPTDVGNAVHRGVLERGAQIAADGPRSLQVRVAESLARLENLMPALPADHRLTVLGTTAMNLDEYLKTRIVETVIHTDDLALSVGVPTPPIDQQTGDVVAHLSVDVARMRSGDLAVVRAFYRRERQSCDALRVF